MSMNEQVIINGVIYDLSENYESDEKDIIVIVDNYNMVMEIITLMKTYKPFTVKINYNLNECFINNLIVKELKNYYELFIELYIIKRIF